MKILILNGFFNHYKDLWYFIKKKNIFEKYYKKLNDIKLNRLIENLKRQFKEDLKLRIVTSTNEQINVSEDIEVQYLSDVKEKIDRLDYKKIGEKLYNKVRFDFEKFLVNLDKLKTFHFKRTSIGNLLELNFFIYFVNIFGKIELLKKIFHMEEYDRIIIFNVDPNFIDIIKYLWSKNKNLVLYQDTLLNLINKKLKWFFIRFYISILSFSLKGLISRKYLKNNSKEKKNKGNIIFEAIKKEKSNQFVSINPIYEHLKKNKIYNPIYYSQLTNFIPIKEFNKLLQFSFQIKKIWFDNQKNIFKNIYYESLKLDKLVKDFYKFELKFLLVAIFNQYIHFKRFCKKYPPSLVIQTDYAGPSPRLILNFCSKKKIPTVYIQHCANDIVYINPTNVDLSYLTTAGEKEKSYFIDKGVLVDKIIVTGRPCYENFYKGEIKKLLKLKDMFNNRVYEFKPNKFTILLTTNPVYKKANEVILTVVINSLKELNLIDNLIIKLHPKENGEIHRTVSKKLNVSPIIVKDYNILEVIKSCDLLLSRGSTTILESMIVGTPPIVLDLNNLEFIRASKKQFLEEDTLITVTSQEQLISKLKNLIENKALYAEYSNQIVEIAKGYSRYDKGESPTEKITKLICKIIENIK